MDAKSLVWIFYDLEPEQGGKPKAVPLLLLRGTVGSPCLPVGGSKNGAKQCAKIQLNWCPKLSQKIKHYIRMGSGRRSGKIEETYIKKRDPQTLKNVIVALEWLQKLRLQKIHQK